MNDGSVAAVAFFISLSFRETAVGVPPKCEKTGDDEQEFVFYTDFSATTVAAKGTVAKTINVVDSNLYHSMGIEKKKKGWYRFPIASELIDGHFQIETCMTVGFVSYANAVEYKTVILDAYPVSKDRFFIEGDGMPLSSVGVTKKPYRLLSYSESIWSMFFGR
jgi:hypothetical protein